MVGVDRGEVLCPAEWGLGSASPVREKLLGTIPISPSYVKER